MYRTICMFVRTELSVCLYVQNYLHVYTYRTNCMFIFTELSVCLYVKLSVCLYVQNYLYVCKYRTTCMFKSTELSVSLKVQNYLSVLGFIYYLYFCHVQHYLYVFGFIYLSVCLSVNPSMSSFICMSVCHVPIWDFIYLSV